MAGRDYSYDPVSTVEALGQKQHRVEPGQLWRQYIIGAIANVAIIATGVSMVWTSPVNIKLTDKDASPLPSIPTPDQLAWIGSLLTIGAIFGPFFSGVAASRIGRKWGILISAIPLLIGWILVTTASNVAMIYAGRFFWGVGGGMTFTLCPMYCAEIATVESRGALGSFLQIFVTVGFMITYAIGPFVSYYVLSYIGFASVAIFCVCFLLVPETPIYYLSKGDRESAGRCLATIRGRTYAGVQAELDVLAAEVRASMEKTATLADVFRGSNLKAFCICCALLFFQQFCGVNAVLFYMTTIFKAAGSSLDSAIATIIIGSVMTVASLITSLVVDRLGRKVLLMISAGGTTIGLCLLGTYFILDANKSPIVQSISFLPVLSLILYIVTYSWGLGPLPWAIMSELLPIEVKVTAAPIATAFCWSMAFLVTRYFSAVAMAVGIGGTFLIFSGCCIAAFLFTVLLVPETKGKSYSEIQQLLAGK